MNEPVESLRLPDGRWLEGECSGDRLTLALAGEDLIRVAVKPEGDTSRLALLWCVEEDRALAVWSACYWQFAQRPECVRLIWSGLEPEGALSRTGLLTLDGVALREQFWQLPRPWRRAASTAGYPESIISSADGVRYPMRPPKPVGEVYRRYAPRVGADISFRTLDIGLDVERFNRWQNSPPVAEFWEQTGTLEEHRAYLETLAADPHCLQLIGCFDDEPFGFFDVYWVPEDRLGGYCEPDNHDRGMHALVGEERHRGAGKGFTWASALAHYLFLDEPRTRAILIEPRYDNQRVIGLAERVGFHHEREFDFPHKRAALMVLTRERFFNPCKLC